MAQARAAAASGGAKGQSPSAENRASEGMSAGAMATKRWKCSSDTSIRHTARRTSGFSSEASSSDAAGTSTWQAVRKARGHRNKQAALPLHDRDRGAQDACAAEHRKFRVLVRLVCHPHRARRVEYARRSSSRSIVLVVGAFVSKTSEQGQANAPRSHA